MVLQKKKLNLGIDSSTILDTYRHILEPNDIDIEFLYGGRDSGKSHFSFDFKINFLRKILIVGMRKVVFVQPKILFISYTFW